MAKSFRWRKKSKGFLKLRPCLEETRRIRRVGLGCPSASAMSHYDERLTDCGSYGIERIRYKHRRNITFSDISRKEHLLLTHAVLDPNHSILLIPAQRALLVSEECTTNRVGKNLIQVRRVRVLMLHTLGYYNEHEKYKMQELLKHLRYVVNICCTLDR